VVALLVALTLIAVPLYLLRRPSVTKKNSEEASAAASASASALASALASAAPPTPKPPERIKLAPAQRVRCGAGLKGGQEGNLCDAIGPVEEALAKAIRDNEACAPKVKQPGTINYVLSVDFKKRSLHLFPGASGDYHGPQARRATTCVERALPKLDWETLRHQYRYYSIAILATYVPENALPLANGQPRFE
jgi:hypothetical protein